MLWHLGLEPFESRYTADWWRWFQHEYRAHHVNYVYVEGAKLTDKIETGRFLDTFGTIHWKMTQMAEVAKLFRNGDIKPGDTFLTCDLWHPGIESIRYMSQLAGIPVRVYGILHAGTYDPNDFTHQAGLESWAKWSEHGWISLCDKVFVGSEYHKQLLIDATRVGALDTARGKVVVTGLPFYDDELVIEYGRPVAEKEDLVVFPSRLDPEKDPVLFDKIMALVDRGYHAKAVKTAEACKTKAEYYDVLSRAKVAVSCSKQETFGYAMLEAQALGCHVVVPDSLSYPEMYGKESRYEPGNVFDAAERVFAGLNDNTVPLDRRRQGVYRHSIERMLKEMRMA